MPQTQLSEEQGLLRLTPQSLPDRWLKVVGKVARIEPGVCMPCIDTLFVQTLTPLWPAFDERFVCLAKYLGDYVLSELCAKSEMRQKRSEPVRVEL